MLIPEIWAKKLVRFNPADVPLVPAAFLIGASYSPLGELLEFISKHGFRSDFKWLVRADVLTQNALNKWLDEQAVNRR